MRLIAAADIHGVNAVYEWLVEQVREADAVVLAGDLFASDFKREQQKQAKRIIRLLKTVAIPVFYVMGNDDNVAVNYEDALAKPIHGRRLQLKGFNFVGCQYMPPFVGGEFVKSDQEIAHDLEQLQPLLDENTIFVTHAPAWGHLDLSWTCCPCHHKLKGECYGGRTEKGCGIMSKCSKLRHRRVVLLERDRERPRTGSSGCSTSIGDPDAEEAA